MSGRVLSDEELQLYESGIGPLLNTQDLIVTIRDRDKTIVELKSLRVQHSCMECGFDGIATLAARCPQCHTVNDVWSDALTHPLHEQNAILFEALEYYTSHPIAGRIAREAIAKVKGGNM